MGGLDILLGLIVVATFIYLIVDALVRGLWPDMPDLGEDRDWQEPQEPQEDD